MTMILSAVHWLTCISNVAWSLEYSHVEVSFSETCFQRAFYRFEQTHLETDLLNVVTCIPMF